MKNATTFSIITIPSWWKISSTKVFFIKALFIHSIHIMAELKIHLLGPTRQGLSMLSINACTSCLTIEMNNI